MESPTSLNDKNHYDLPFTESDSGLVEPSFHSPLRPPSTPQPPEPLFPPMITQPLHGRVQSLDPYACFECSEVFQSHSRLFRHGIETWHRPYACICGNTYSSFDAFRHHSSRAADRHPCPLCTMYDGEHGFIRRSHLQQHLRVIHKVEDNKRQDISRLHVDVTGDEQKTMAEEQPNKFLQESQGDFSSEEVLVEDEDADYDEEVINNARPQVRNFLAYRSPLENLREGLRTSVQPPKNRRQRLVAHSSQGEVVGGSAYVDCTDNQVLFQSLPVLIDGIFDLLIPPQEPPVPNGKKRVRWICRCGARLFDDFIELEPGAVENLEAELQQSASTGRSEALKNAGKLLGKAITSWIKLPFTEKGLRNSNPATPLPLHNMNAQATPTIPQGGVNLRLLLCIQKGDFQTMLHQKIIEKYSNDKELFKFLSKEYHDYRKLRTWFTLRGIGQLSLTRFTVDLGCFAEVHKHADICDSSCVCLPPKDKIDVEYRCNPAPKIDPGYVPAIGSARLTHYFRSPECVDKKQTTIYAQLPKRTCGELSASDISEELGWGIHFQEGWHWRTIYVIIVVFLISFSLIFGIVWSVSKADIQGAFAIASFWLTLGSILLGYLAIRSQ